MNKRKASYGDNNLWENVNDLCECGHTAGQHCLNKDALPFPCETTITLQHIKCTCTAFRLAANQTPRYCTICSKGISTAEALNNHAHSLCEHFPKKKSVKLKISEADAIVLHGLGVKWK
jgi:hypothetical protein